MTNNLLKRWIVALRSGDYQQVQSRLKRGTGSGGPGVEDVGYCCLGVLCELVDPSGWEWDVDEEEYIFTRGTETSFEQLPFEVANLIGMTETGTARYPVRMVEIDGVESLTSMRPDGYSEEAWDELDQYEELTSLNDESGASFSQIADLLENEYEHLFAE